MVLMFGWMWCGGVENEVGGWRGFGGVNFRSP